MDGYAMSGSLNTSLSPAVSPSVSVSSGRPAMSSLSPLAVITSMVNNMTSTVLDNVTQAPLEVCTEPAFREFPPDAFTAEQRAHGAFVFHLMLTIYMFIALAIVCDDYFVASLDKVCERLGFSEDVAGATFMAAGSSAPELFTAVIGVFITQGDVGVGTIVGSAVFNILFVIGICGLLVKETIRLSWWPMCRDSAYYCLAIVVLIISRPADLLYMLVVYDAQVTWYESLLMLLLYFGYILIMRFNRSLQNVITSKLKWFASEKISANGVLGKQLNKFQDYEQFGDDDDVFSVTMDMTECEPRKMSVDHYASTSNFKLTFEEAAFKIMMTRYFSVLCRFKAAVRLSICYNRRMQQDMGYQRRQKFQQVNRGSMMRSYTKSVRNWVSMALEDDVDCWMTKPVVERDGYFSLVRWVLLYPIRIVLYYTIPDCRKPRWERYFVGTFLASIVWIMIFSYVMVWMVTYIGYALSIPDSVMGITFLAAGTSIPDAMASVIVAKQGMGDMAVSNSIGSNIFDILLGLSFPWFLKTAVFYPGTIAHINSNGLVFSIVLLFLTVLLTIGAVHTTGWVLNKCVGVTCLTVYAIYVIFATMIECNVFGFVNPPMC